MLRIFILCVLLCFCRIKTTAYLSKRTFIYNGVWLCNLKIFAYNDVFFGWETIMDFNMDYAKQLMQLQQTSHYRSFRQVPSDLLNLSSNDYLAIGENHDLYQEFMDNLPLAHKRFGATSSRLLTGNFAAHEHLEHSLKAAFARSALVFNSGYHMNVGILPALCDDKTLIVADKWVHASIIDGIRLSGAKFLRFAHQDFAMLEQILQKNSPHYQQIIIVTESLFSMDGDMTDLCALVALKERFDNVRLYVDDAHGVGVYGDTGLGVAQMQGVISGIDFLLGTFGKALASVGGYVLCDDVIRSYLINTMRPLIFSTALPPINMAWTNFVFEKVQSMNRERTHLATLSQTLRNKIGGLGLNCPSDSHIVPIILGDNERAVKYADCLQQSGFYVLPIRPPTVPKNTARVRLCLNSGMTMSDIEKLGDVLQGLMDKK